MIEKTLPNGSKVNCYPLIAAQQLMFYLSLSYGGESPVLNIGSGYYWQGEMDDELMKEAIEEAIDRCDTMRLHFLPDEKYKVVQFVSPKSDITIETLDYTDLTEEEAFAKFKEYTRQMIDMFRGPIHTVRLVHLPNGRNGFYLKLHHLAMDGYSTKIFISDIMSIYLHKKCGKPYPKPMKSYEAALAQEFAYIGSEQHKADQYYWAHTLDTEPIFTDYLLRSRLVEQREAQNNPNLRAAAVHSGNPEAATIVFNMTQEESQRLTDMCAKKEISLPCALMLGLRCALSVFNENEEDISFKLMINRRGTLLEKKSGGMRMHFFPLRTIVSPDTSFVEAARMVEDAQNELFMHSNISSLEMLQIRHKYMKTANVDDTYDSMSFSYQPLMEIPAENEQMKKTSCGIWYNNDYSIQNLYLTVMHRSFDDGLDFIFEYRINAKPLEDIKVFYNKLYRSLLIGTENPDISIGELLTKISD